MTPLFLLFFKKRSNYAAAREGEFVKTPEFDDAHVYKGRYLTREEFNALSGSEIFEAERYTEVVCFRCDLVAEESDEEEENEGEGDNDGDGNQEPTEPAIEDPTDPTDPTDLTIEPEATTEPEPEPETTEPEPANETDEDITELAAELAALQNKQLVAEKAESLGVIVDPTEFTRDALEAEVLRLVRG